MSKNMIKEDIKLLKNPKDKQSYPGGSPEKWKEHFSDIDSIYEEFLTLKAEGKLGS